MFQQIIFHPLTAVIITIVAVAFWGSMLRSQLRFRQAEAPLAQLETEIQGLQAEVNELETELRIASSAATKERIARNDLLLKRPGEYVIYIEQLELRTPEEASVSTTTPRAAWLTLLREGGGSR